jgi:hypothetical protein
MEEKGGENQAKLERHIVVKLKLDLGVLQNATDKEQLDGKDEHSFPEDVELV